VTAESTFPIAVQRSAIQTVAELADQFPDLPDAYIIIHQSWMGAPARLKLQLDTPTGFEQWRTALGIKPAAVHLYPHGVSSWVLASTVRDGIDIEISAHGILLTQDQLSAPRTRDEVPA
jgi:hypothetical protein